MDEGFDGDEFSNWSYHTKGDDIYIWIRDEYEIKIFVEYETRDWWYIVVHTSDDMMKESKDTKREAFVYAKNKIQDINQNHF